QRAAAAARTRLTRIETIKERISIMMNGMYMNDMAWWFGAHWLMMLLGAVVIVLPFWKIFAKAGFSGWLGLLMIVPMVNLIALYVLAFSEWPRSKRADKLDSGEMNPGSR
ncbi:MAG: hypothetical protein KA131_01210, partial [Thauera sp.]|nr:hypothetical protein [Thauera sp.]